MQMSKESVPGSRQIRSGFLEFFRERQHAIVPSSSLLPDAPNLMFTNAGMNQFVPIFLGETPCPFRPGRAADTQKCIRAGGKHNDLDDVGWDTYHHTFFEMLGNWSFGDYFKREAIQWSWELLTGVWGFPKERLYATVYSPGEGDPSEFDREAHDIWADLLTGEGLDPALHLIRGGSKDNFWMMGDTGPCGPCSEIHVDLTQQGDTRGALVNKDSSECIELWNLVFIQFNANPDGSFSDLPQRHVDTGMGFERVVSIIQNTRCFRNFGAVISNYDTDVFASLFRTIEQLSGKSYQATLPSRSSREPTGQERVDVAFRIIADHVRTLAFALADGIEPGNTDRNYVLRRILRRAVRNGRDCLGLERPFFHRLIEVLDEGMGGIFPELRAGRSRIEEIIRDEEESFRHTLDKGTELFQDQLQIFRIYDKGTDSKKILPGDLAFELYDTYGIPLESTVRMAREQGHPGVDTVRFDELMTLQRKRARAARKTEVIEVTGLSDLPPTRFCGFDETESRVELLKLVNLKEGFGVVTYRTPFHPEMGGQIGDRGIMEKGEEQWQVADTRKVGNSILHMMRGQPGSLSRGDVLTVRVDASRRRGIERHHTVTHLLHWALHQVVSRDAGQKGSHVADDKLTFDFNAQALEPAQIRDIEQLVNERILDNETIHAFEVDRRAVEGRRDVMQFFGEKYDSRVRVVQIGGRPEGLDGFSMELCGGTHVRSTGQIGLFRIRGEGAISSGIRRIEAAAGTVALKQVRDEASLLERLSSLLNAPLPELERRLGRSLEERRFLEKRLEALQERMAAERSRSLLSQARTVVLGEDRNVPLIVQNLGDADARTVQNVAEGLRSRFPGVIVLGGSREGSALLVAMVGKDCPEPVRADGIIRAIAPDIGGKGGGRPDFARGGGRNPEGLDQALSRVDPWIRDHLASR